MTTTADFVIIGGGVHGCSLAFHLAKENVGHVVLLEKKHIAAGPTAQSGAMIRALFDAKIYVDLVMASTRMFEQWDELIGGDAGFVQDGFLRIADSLAAQTLGGDLELTKQAGEPYEILSRDQLAQLVPMGQFQQGEVGLLFPKGGYADPFRTTVELAAAARRHGAEIHEDVSVTGIEIQRGRVAAVDSTQGRIATPLIVNCAGAWSDRIARMAGIELPIDIQRTTTTLFLKPESMKTVGPVLSDGVNQVYLRGMGDAVYRAAHFGHSHESVDADDFDVSVSTSELKTLRTGLDPRYDDMRRAPYLGGFTTLYDMTPDGHPIVGPIQDVAGFWCDCGWSGNGFAPAGGRSLAQMILGRVPDIDLAYFQWPRRDDVIRRPSTDWILW